MTDANQTEVHQRVQEPGGAGAAERGKSVAEACQEYELTAQLVDDWKRQFLIAAPQVFEQGASSSVEAERIAELEQIVGRLTIQLEITKKPYAG